MAKTQKEKRTHLCFSLQLQLLLRVLKINTSRRYYALQLVDLRMQLVHVKQLIGRWCPDLQSDAVVNLYAVFYRTRLRCVEMRRT